MHIFVGNKDKNLPSSMPRYNILYNITEVILTICLFLGSLTRYVEAHIGRQRMLVKAHRHRRE